MPAKLIRMQRLERSPAPRPIVLAIAGDSASGKTTLARGLVSALGPERCTSICVDDYHRYDRTERASLAMTPLHPHSNHIDVMEQHLQLLALGRPILKPVYDHSNGHLVRPEYVASREFLIVEGLLPLSTKLARACFDVAVYLDPDDDLRRTWKLKRDIEQRGYAAEEVLLEMQRRQADARQFVAPQRRDADIVVRFAPAPGDGTGAAQPLSVDLLLRPTVRHPPLANVLTEDHRSAIHLKIVRDEGTPTDLLHVDGHTPAEETRRIEELIWSALDEPGDIPVGLGETAIGTRSEALAITQLILLHHLLHASTDVTA
jgi:phosphoribulokinase